MRAILRSGVLLVAVVSAGWPARAADSSSEEGPKLSSKTVLVIHNKSGRALLGRAASEVRSIASLTKLQAALVLRDRKLDLDKGTEITRADHGVALRGCRTRLELKWIYRNHDLLHAALMSSDNRATSALGRAVGLHPTALVQAMNERARRQGLKQTRFAGPVGIDHGNVSTAWELSRIVREASRDATLRAIMSKREYRVKPLRGYLAVHYRNTNPLVGARPDTVFVASKTGYNDAAGYCLAAVTQIAGFGEHTFILLGAKSKLGRVRDLRALIRWVRTRGKQRPAS